MAAILGELSNSTVSQIRNGTATPTADGVLTTFNIAHGIGATPTSFCVMPNNALSAALLYATADGTNISVVYAVAPLAGSLSLKWTAFA